MLLNRPTLSLPQSPNVLLTDGLRAKVADFGLARVLHASVVTTSAHSSAHAPTGTYHWMAPELLRGDAHSRRPPADVYSYGVVLFELLSGQRPWANARSAAEVIAAVGWGGKRVELPTGLTSACPLLAALMNRCLATSPAERPTFLEIVGLITSFST